MGRAFNEIEAKACGNPWFRLSRSRPQAGDRKAMLYKYILIMQQNISSLAKNIHTDTLALPCILGWIGLQHSFPLFYSCCVPHKMRIIFLDFIVNWHFSCFFLFYFLVGVLSRLTLHLQILVRVRLCECIFVCVCKCHFVQCNSASLWLRFVSVSVP